MLNIRRTIPPLHCCDKAIRKYYFHRYLAYHGANCVVVLVQARRAFRALKGIIRLQALIRGHLVRRQAVSTLRATWLIVKFQALVRGRNVRLSQPSIQATRELSQQKFGVISLQFIFYTIPNLFIMAMSFL